jgi:hypothetical protein
MITGPATEVPRNSGHPPSPLTTTNRGKVTDPTPQWGIVALASLPHGCWEDP